MEIKENDEAFIDAGAIRKLAVRLGQATLTSVEFYYNLPWRELKEFAREVTDAAEERNKK